MRVFPNMGISLVQERHEQVLREASVNRLGRRLRDARSPAPNRAKLASLLRATVRVAVRELGRASGRS